MKKKVFLGVVIIIIGYLFCQNRWIQKEYIDVSWEKSMKNEEVKVAQISDLHLRNGKKNIESTLKKLREEVPDIIFLTGDLIDAKGDIEKCELSYFAQEVEKIAPTFAVYGNHEHWNGCEEKWKQMLLENGIEVLVNEKIITSIKGIRLGIIGVDDGFVDGEIKEKSGDLGQTDINILLSHRPGIFSNTKFINSQGVDLIFSGHAHGGQFRIPFINKGVIAPNQGFMPEYTSGVYTRGNIKMVVSRGIGNSIIPIRINNRPHIPIVTLKL